MLIHYNKKLHDFLSWTIHKKLRIIQAIYW